MSQATPVFLSLASAYNSRSYSPAASDTPSIVYLVCHDAAVRKSLQSLIDSAGWHPEVFASPREFLVSARALSPSCLVLDGSLPGPAGLDFFVRIITADRIDMPIIFIMGDSDVSMTVRVMKAGASEVLTKPFHNEALLDAIEQALERSRTSFSDDLEVRALRARYALLSPREREIMALVVLGRLNKQIAGELGISEITVKAHRGKMKRKMSARSVPQLVIMYAMLGIDSPLGMGQRLRLANMRHGYIQRASDPHEVS